MMKILVSGSTGLIGTALIASLENDRHTVVRLVRAPVSAGDASVEWDPDRGRLDAARLEGLDGVVHLAGENVGYGRWTEAKKRRILDSRARGTALLSSALASLRARPRVLVAASAIGFYGDRGEEILTESSPPGKGFLADVCRAWENATGRATKAGIRVVHARFGTVLNSREGALARMLPVFRWGLGGRLGSGRQYMSWIHLDDAVRVIRRAIDDGALTGPVNAAAPGAVTNREFTRALARMLGRPAFAAVPARILKLAFGEMAEALLLSSNRVQPQKLAGSGFSFRFPEIEPALRDLLRPA